MAYDSGNAEWDAWMSGMGGSAPAAPAEYWIPPTASFGDDPSGRINQQNPYADAGRPFVNEGKTGGYLQGVGVTIGEGRSTTPAQAMAQINSARASGIDQGWIADFLRRNPGDTNRLEEAYRSEFGGAGIGMSREQSEAYQRAGGSFTNTPGMTGTMGGGGGSGDGGGGGGGRGGSSLSDFASPRPYSAFTERFNAPSLDDARNSVGWQFRVGEAQKGLERGAASKGNLLTGGTQSAMASRLQDLASAEYDKIYGRAHGEYGDRYNIHQSNEMNRFNSERSNLLDQFGIYTGERGMDRADRLDDFNIWNTMDENYYNRMAGLANTGFNAAGRQGDYLTQIGNVQGAGTVGSNNAWMGALGGITNQIGQQQAMQQAQSLASMAQPAPAAPTYSEWNTQPYSEPQGFAPASMPSFIDPSLMFGGGSPDTSMLYGGGYY